MKVALIAALSGALLAVGAQALPSAIGSSEDSNDALVRPAASRTTEDATTDRTTTDRTTPDRTTPDRTTTAPASPGVDISGPCDEAEHANDPRCTGVSPGATRGGDDDRGRDDDDRGRDDDDDDDSSGHGSGSDDDDDHSGSGHGGDDDD